MEFAERVPRRRLGVDGPEVPLLALGSWNTWDRMDREDAAELLRLAVDRGVDMFDVAHYDFGPHAEDAVTDVLFGQAVRDAGIAREDYLLCGKLWLWEYPASSFAEQLEVSLGRIGTDRADMVVVGDFMERPDLRAVVADVSELVRAGRFASWGVNNWLPGTCCSPAGSPSPRDWCRPRSRSSSTAWPAGRRRRGPVRQAVRRRGLASQASDVLEGGILAGKLHPERKIGADPGGIRDRIRASFPEVRRIADEFGATPAQLAIAYCLAHPAVANVLVGVTRSAQLEDNLAALGLCARRGDELRDACAGLWIDKEVADPGLAPTPRRPPGRPGRSSPPAPRAGPAARRRTGRRPGRTGRRPCRSRWCPSRPPRRPARRGGGVGAQRLGDREPLRPSPDGAVQAAAGDRRRQPGAPVGGQHGESELRHSRTPASSASRVGHASRSASSPSASASIGSVATGMPACVLSPIRCAARTVSVFRRAGRRG